MSGLSVILWGASFLWAYALVLCVAWVRAVGRETMDTHVSHWVSLMAVLVPPTAGSLLIVLMAAAFDIAWFVPILLVALPGGLVISLQLEVSRLGEASLRTELARLGAALALTLAFSVRS